MEYSQNFYKKMNEDNITAVEWLALELYENFEMKGDGHVFNKILEHAKKIERNQRIKDYDAGWYNGFKHSNGSNKKITAAQYVDNIE